ncbi:arrestin-related trafficking adapter 5 [Monosporozyma servazzii]
MFSIGSKGQTVRVKDHEICIDSPYKDMILIVGHPLENDKIPLNGMIKFCINVDKLVVKKVSLKLTGQFKLEFVQIGTKNSNTKGVAVVKERSPIFECQWDNLMRSQDGDVTMHINSIDQGGSDAAASPNKKRFKLKRNGSGGSGSVTVDVTPENLMSVIDQDRVAGTKVQYRFSFGEYCIPFRAMLPNDIPATIEGLQSGSILYTLESNIDCKYNTFNTDNELDNDGNGSTGPSGVSIGSSANLMGTYNARMSQYHTYKYLRILRTMNVNNLNIDEEMVVSNTLRDRLQYEIKIPSRAIAIGGDVNIDIKIFPFTKQLRLNKISVMMIQQYFIKDLKGAVYDNEITIFKKSMRSFGSLLLDDNRLYKELQLNSTISLPGDLKSVTQSCSIRDEKYIQVIHKLRFQLQFKRYDAELNEWKNLEIRANLPIIVYVSPYVNIKGRLVFYDQMNGKIHFRTGEMIELFENSGGGQGPVQRGQYEYYDEDMSHKPPPTYEEYNRDQLVVLPVSINGVSNTTVSDNAVSDSHTDELTTMANNMSGTIPSYEQATSR